MDDSPNIPPLPCITAVKVDPSNLNVKADFPQVAAALLQEMASWLRAASLLVPTPPDGWKDTQEAVLCGHVVRLSKILGRVSNALRQGDGEAALMFSRCATETIVNFNFLLRPGQEGLDRLRLFKEAGFRPELKIRRDLRERHAAKEGSELDPSEVGALEGLNDFWSTHSLPDKVVDLPSMEDRLRKSGMDPKTDLFFISMPSQAIHGTYQNIMDFHLEQIEEGVFAPRFAEVDINIVVPLGALESSLGVLDHWVYRVHHKIHQQWRESLVELRNRLETVHQSLARIVDQEL